VNEWQIPGGEPILTGQGELWEHRLEIVGVVGIVRRQEQGSAERIGRLVDGYAGPVRRVLH